MVRLQYFLYPMEQLLSKTWIWLLLNSFFCRDILRTIFDNQYTLCNETKKTDYVMEIENKQDLRSSHWCSIFYSFLTDYVMEIKNKQGLRSSHWCSIFYSFLLWPCRCYWVLQGSLVVVVLLLPWLEDSIEHWNLYSHGTLSGFQIFFQFSYSLCFLKWASSPLSHLSRHCSSRHCFLISPDTAVSVTKRVMLMLTTYLSIHRELC
jgi:hypothetical protein